MSGFNWVCDLHGKVTFDTTKNHPIPQYPKYPLYFKHLIDDFKQVELKGELIDCMMPIELLKLIGDIVPTFYYASHNGPFVQAKIDINVYLFLRSHFLYSTFDATIGGPTPKTYFATFEKEIVKTYGSNVYSKIYDHLEKDRSFPLEFIYRRFKSDPNEYLKKIEEYIKTTDIFLKSDARVYYFKDKITIKPIPIVGKIEPSDWIEIKRLTDSVPILVKKMDTMESITFEINEPGIYQMKYWKKDDLLPVGVSNQITIIDKV